MTSQKRDHGHPNPHPCIPMRNHDGTVMLDHRGRIVYRTQFLSTHPLRSECKERVGYAGKKFVYASGEGVIRTMNAVFGHTGWSTELTREKTVLCEKDDKGRWVVGYIATVRVALTDGVSHEDCGTGEGINENKIKAHEKAMKSAVTDAMKRAARHFGERLGNALYVKGNGLKTAPMDNRKALEQLEKRDDTNMFGDQRKLHARFDDINENNIETMTSHSGSDNVLAARSISSDEDSSPNNKNITDGGVNDANRINPSNNGLAADHHQQPPTNHSGNGQILYRKHNNIENQNQQRAAPQRIETTPTTNYQRNIVCNSSSQQADSNMKKTNHTNHSNKSSFPFNQDKRNAGTNNVLRSSSSMVEYNTPKWNSPCENQQQQQQYRPPPTVVTNSSPSHHRRMSISSSSPQQCLQQQHHQHPRPPSVASVSFGESYSTQKETALPPQAPRYAPLSSSNASLKSVDTDSSFNSNNQYYAEQPSTSPKRAILTNSPRVAKRPTPAKNPYSRHYVQE